MSISIKMQHDSTDNIKNVYNTIVPLLLTYSHRL